jgi:transcriptional regulator with XRE-family HTH domain
MAAPITDFAAKLKALGIKNRDLARALGMTEETISKWTRGHRDPPMAVRLLIDLLHQNPLIAKSAIDNHLRVLRTRIQAPPRRSKFAAQTERLGEIVADANRQLDADDRLDAEMSAWLES